MNIHAIIDIKSSKPSSVYPSLPGQGTANAIFSLQLPDKEFSAAAKREKKNVLY